MSPRACAEAYLRQASVERGLSAHTLAAYRRDLELYLGWLEERGTVDLAQLGRVDVGEFSSWLAARPERPLAASSRARILSSVRGLHRFALEEGVVADDVARDVLPPKIPMTLPKAVTVEQMAALLDAARGEELADLRDRALLELLYATGARISEAVDLNVDDVVAAEVVRLTGKGSKQRMVPLGRFAREAVDEYLVRARPELSRRGRATPALFLGVRGSRLSRQSAWLVIRAVAEKAGLDREISPHTFRHSFATHLLAGGADVRVVQELLGHASVATTQIYTLVTADTLRDVYTSAHPRARR
ncbi:MULTISPECIES: site-specific tyrosine recombinase XerD [unclassified Rathayibacter]|uniref:site-specific tyrosine recombinase XerD n=1 Tax=unclassified Rathayibacter TaxID=2609250 RepID=UPI000CE8E896|nr:MULTISPECIES: site-specific tyrosine recombinase XerD [unclassified Rathayibacter]PPF35779.1 site-specific tyrosine recombinase XerD [Rathayibacter sp. AY1A2]PPG15844.1 site-specific tyrosine recombinase XerD [Rathayibacter sp. AY1C6]PPH94755.1 site-specific tyrosine recombinase XerD [Rathayibacter sp. AY1D5]PPI09094.1 site-specific tyrosine recombinase XerD [Rathayibacter sp. AY1B8]PPI18503.1 site-specific tyrosine recombinase XerD [Rathayibacter sp. AY1D2]